MEILGRAVRDGSKQELEEDIAQLEAAMNLADPPRKFLESCLYVDDKFIVASLLTDSPLPIERLFGDADWARYLQARLYTKTEDRPYQGSEIDTIEMVQAFLCCQVGQKESPFRGYQGFRGGRFVDGVFLPILFTPKQLDGLTSQQYATFLSADDPSEPLLGYIKYPDMHPEDIRWNMYGVLLNKALTDPDPYRAAAHFQQGVIGLHPAAGEKNAANGRMSRVLMNWLLERRGCLPSILPDFDDDLFSTADEWHTTVQTGSTHYGELQQAITAGEEDAVALMGLNAIKRFHDEIYTPSSDIVKPVYYPDMFHTHCVTDTYLQDVYQAAAAAGIRDARPRAWYGTFYE